MISNLKVFALIKRKCVFYNAAFIYFFLTKQTNGVL